MSLFAPIVDEVRVLTGGENLFELLYQWAEAVYPRAIWVEGFGTVKGASIVELVGDRHRESVREATLSGFQATICSNGEKPLVRSVATLSWRDKRTPEVRTGFLASALATHVTLRVREVELLTGDAAHRPPEQEARGTSSKNPSSPSRGRSPIQEASVKRPPADTSTKDRMDAQGEEEIPIRSHRANKASAVVDHAPVMGWGDVAASVEAKEKNEVVTRVETEAVTTPMTSTNRTAGTTTDVAGWGAVAARSEALAETSVASARDLKKGEVLVHPTLGECTILSIVSESVVMIKPTRERMRKISLKPFRIQETSRRGFYELSKS